MVFPDHPAAPVDARPFFVPLHAALLELLRGMRPEQWRQPSGVGAWSVHQLVAHLLDGMLRRVAAERDGWTQPPASPITDYASLVAHVNRINRSGVEGLSHRSPRQLIDALDRALPELLRLFDASPLDAKAFYAVSWMGQSDSPHWLDVARELTEQWHHQQQLRVAVGAPEWDEPATTHAVIRTWLMGLPYAYRAATAAEGHVLHLVVEGSGGGSWRMRRAAEAWQWADHEPTAHTTLRISVGVLWRLYSKLLTPDQACAQLQASGDAALAEPLLHYLPFLAVRER